MVHRPPPPLLKQICSTRRSTTSKPRAGAFWTAVDKTSTSATWTSQSSAPRSSATWRPSTSTSSTSTYPSTVMRTRPPRVPCPPTRFMGKVHLGAAPTARPTVSPTVRRGAKRAPHPPRPLATAIRLSSDRTSKRNS